MQFSEDMQIIEFDSFETAFPVQPGKEDDAKRRFMTLFAQEDESARVGGTSYVCKAVSFTGEEFALKRLLASAGIPKDANLTPEDTARITQGHADAFYEEYKNQLLVSRMRGFPRVYGYGMIGDDPAIVMEWVEGISLRDMAREAADAGKPLSAQTIARIGVSTLEILYSVTRLDNTLVHRDVSPANIMIRTSDASIEEQVELGDFDVCLIDFGSASADAQQDPSFTMMTQVWRNGTPEYAPPEMLTQDIPHIDVLRKSQAIDVFALSSVLYELYAGHTPWRVGDVPDLSPFRIKTERAAETIALRASSDAPLVSAIMDGLAIDQSQRPSVKQLMEELRAFAPDKADAEGASVVPAAGVGVTKADVGALVPGGHEWLPAGLYTPDSTHLKVAGEGEGGRRAGEDIEPYKRPPTLLTRRSVLIGGIALAMAAVGGAFAARSCGAETAVDFSNYPTTDAVYSGDALYPAMRSADSSWILRDTRSGAEVSLGSTNREPGRFVNGLMKLYDASAGGYGFATVIAGADGGPSFAWRVLPRYLDAGDFSVATSPDVSDAPVRLAAVRDRKTAQWGYIGVDGEYAVNPAYASAGRFSCGYAAVRPEGGAAWGLIDEDGNQVLTASFSSLGCCSSEGLLAAAQRSGSRWGFVDVQGAWAVPDEYYQVRRFSEGLAAVRRDEGGAWGYIDAGGNQVIEARFCDAFPFSGDYAPAQDEESRLWGLIDKSGAWHVEPRYLSIGEKTGSVFPAHGSPANVYNIYKTDRRAWHEYETSNSDKMFGYGFASESGEWVVKPIYGDTLVRQPEQ